MSSTRTTSKRPIPIVVAVRRIANRNLQRILPTASRLLVSPQLREWRKADGDLTLRFEYPLGSGDVVMDVGGYRGGFASEIYSRFRCKVHVYEPIPKFASFIQDRFRENPDITVHTYGLAGSTRMQHFRVEEDASMAVSSGADSVLVPLESASDEIDRIGEVSLLELNIEGLEYELLDSLIESGRINRIRYIQVQFHDFVPAAASLRASIQERLLRTHSIQWEFPLVWESWQRAENSA